jgi:hypothetical protein
MAFLLTFFGYIALGATLAAQYATGLVEGTGLDAAGATPELRVSDAERSITRDAIELSNQPIASSNITNVITLSPGVTPTFNPRGGN